MESPYFIYGVDKYTNMVYNSKGEEAMMKILIVLLVFGFTGCATNELKELDTKIEVQGDVAGKSLGLQDDVAVLQEKRLGEDELRLQIWRNYQLENDLNHQFHMTEWCYEDLADPRLGGNGEVADAPDLKKIKNSAKVKEEIGLEDKRIVVVKTSNFVEALQVERQYEKSLADMLIEVKKTRGSCERKMGVARIKAGLPSKRFQGKVLVNQKGNVQEVVKEHENNLDDAFDIKKSIKGKVIEDEN